MLIGINDDFLASSCCTCKMKGKCFYRYFDISKLVTAYFSSVSRYSSILFKWGSQYNHILAYCEFTKNVKKANYKP